MSDEVAELRRELARSRRIIDALIERVERATDFNASDSDGTNYLTTAFSVFETAVAWDRRVQARTADQYRALNDLAIAMADLEHANAALQREIRERTAAEAALIDAKHLAEQHNAEKTRFLLAVSHDLIQPLNAARLFLGALANHRLPGPSHTLVHQAGSALDSVEEILEALLEIAQLDVGAIQPSIEALDLDALLEHLVREFAPVAHDRKLTLAAVCDGVHVASDARLLRRILQNLISNALRYTRKGGVAIVATRKGGQVSIDVRDTGPGIARAHREIIFREFSRLERHRDASGAGLGLAIVDRAARTLGHRVTLLSRVGRGSTFRLTLPAAVPIASRSPVADSSSSVPLRGCRILVIENEASSLDALVALLEGWGCVVAAAADKAEALRICRRRAYRPDLIIADFHLDDGVNGEEVIAAIRAALASTIPAIIVTADRDDRLRGRLVRMGFSILSKPVQPSQLQALAQELASF